MLTAAQIRALYVAQIGEANTAKLAAAGLLPTAQEENWGDSGRPTSYTTEGNVRTAIWNRRVRYVTTWTTP